VCVCVSGGKGAIEACGDLQYEFEAGDESMMTMMMVSQRLHLLSRSQAVRCAWSVLLSSVYLIADAA
jgi:hypothetical protein